MLAAIRPLRIYSLLGKSSDGFCTLALVNGTEVLGSFTTVYSNVGSYRRPPPLSRLGTGIG